MKQKARILQMQRVWEIDAYRGFRILAMLALHLYITVDEFCINGYYKIDSYAYVNFSDPFHFWFDWDENGIIYRAFLNYELLDIWTTLGVIGFFIVSGISCTFTRDNFSRSIRLLIAGYGISALTYGLYLWTGNEDCFIRFGAILCYAYCHLIYAAFLEKRSNKCLIALSALILVLGYYLKYNPIYSEWSILYPFGIREVGLNVGEYFPIMPSLGWVLLGVVWGRKFYPEKKSLIPSPIMERLTRPLQWCGRYSGILYMVHMVAYPAVFLGIGYIFHLF